MTKLRLSIHSDEYIWLRELLLNRRKELGLSQRAFGEKLGVVHSFIGKVETGDRRLDVFEFIEYCKGLDLDPIQVLREIEEKIENFSYKDMVKVVNNSTENIIDFGNDVKPLFERTFTEYSEDTLKECEQDYFESLGRKKLLPILLKEIEENVEHFKEVKGFMINDVDNEFGREDDYYQFRDKLMKDVSNEFYNTFVTSVFNLDYKVEKEDKKEEKEKLIEFFGVNPLLANDFFKFISSNKIDENLFDELYDKLEDVMDKTITQEDGKQIEFVSPYEIDKNGKLSFDIKREKVDLKEIKELQSQKEWNSPPTKQAQAELDTQIKDLRKQAAAIDDAIAKWNKRIENLHKEGKITLSIYMEVMERIFEALRLSNEPLYMQTLDFQENHLEDVAAKLV